MYHIERRIKRNGSSPAKMSLPFPVFLSPL
nr:MAG TPA: hypothetical protein [Bacteriophage sp.]